MKKIAGIFALLLCPSLCISRTLTAWGDSLTAGAGGTPWPAQFAALSGATVLNRGVGGDTSTQIADRMQAEPARFGDYTVIWAGRNNYSDAVAVQLDIARMVSSLTTSDFLILGVINGNYGGYESVGGAGYVSITNLNVSLSLTYGSRFVDVRSILVNSYNPLLPQDLSDFARNIVPASLRSDNIHLNTAGYGLVAEAVYSAIPESSSYPVFVALASLAYVKVVRRRRVFANGCG